MTEKIKLMFVPCSENGYRPRFLDGRVLFYYAILILVLKFSLLPFFVYFPKSLFFAEITKSALIQFVNQTRESFNLQLLKEDSKLNQAAYLKAKDMFKKNYFSHQSPEGIWPWDWLKKVGYHYQLAGENLAIGFLDPEEVHQAWMDSPSHKANILNPNYQEIGIAVLKEKFEGTETVIVVQLFGRQKVLVKEIEKPKADILQEPLEMIEEREILSVQPEILSQLEVSSQARAKAPEDSFTFRFLKFMAFNYNIFVQKFVYGSLIFLILLLLINIFVKIEIQHKDLIFKTLAFIGLLILFIWLDKTEIIQLIPHQFRIY